MNVTPWFLGVHDAPVREGRYQVRFCVGWREVFCVWRDGAWWVCGGGLDEPARVNLKRWPGFHWRGLAEPNPADWAACMRKKLDDLRRYNETM